MAMTGSGLKSAIISALNAEFGSELENIPDNHQISDYDRETFQNRYWGAICNSIVSYIQSNAQAIGTDTPTGDTHTLSIT